MGQVLCDTSNLNQQSGQKQSMHSENYETEQLSCATFRRQETNAAGICAARVPYCWLLLSSEARGIPLYRNRMHLLKAPYRATVLNIPVSQQRTRTLCKGVEPENLLAVQASITAGL